MGETVEETTPSEKQQQYKIPRNKLLSVGSSSAAPMPEWGGKFSGFLEGPEESHLMGYACPRPEQPPCS